MSSTARGNAGEHLVMAELLRRGFDAYWADRGNPAYDVACFWNDRASRLRVKTTSNSSAVWSIKKDGAIFRDIREADDFVVIVDMAGGVRGAAVYVVPTSVVERRLRDDASAYYAAKPGRNENNRMIAIRFYGPERPDNPTFCYDQKFAEFREAWELLK